MPRLLLCPPLTSSNGFTFSGLVCTNLLDAHAYKHTAYGGCQITEPFSYQKRHLGFMPLLCFAHYSQLQINRRIVFLSFTDRQTRQLFLPLHKSRNCFHTLPTGTVPFIKEIYLELSRGAAKEWGKDEHWLNLSMKMFEALSVISSPHRPGALQ